jgi:hypothetical protein
MRESFDISLDYSGGLFLHREFTHPTLPLLIISNKNQNWMAKITSSMLHSPLSNNRPVGALLSSNTRPQTFVECLKAMFLGWEHTPVHTR